MDGEEEEEKEGVVQSAEGIFYQARPGVFLTAGGGGKGEESNTATKR